FRSSLNLTYSLLSFLTIPSTPISTLFPYTTLFRSPADIDFVVVRENTEDFYVGAGGKASIGMTRSQLNISGKIYQARFDLEITRDRKSTRLNSSHQIISYAVFCLKKKNKKNTPQIK